MNKNKIIKMVSLIMVLIVVIGVTIYLFPVMKDILTKEGQVAFRDKINEAGFVGLLILTGLQIVQILLVVLPGEPLEILAGMCYGPIWGTVFIMVTSTLISILIVLLVNKYGKKLVYEFFDEKKVNKVVNSRVFQNPKRIEFIMLTLFLIPGTPKDLLVYIGGLLPINPKRFIVISSIARIPSVVSSTIAGGSIANGEIWPLVWAYVMTYAVVGAIILVLNRKDKGRTMAAAMRKLK